MADIFISHIHEEAIAAQGLTDFLERYSLDTFLSSESAQIRLGERWFSRIERELESARIVILMLSPVSVSRPWINFEAGWAWAQSKLTIPACFGDLAVGNMPRPYSDLQGVQLETGYLQLVTECYFHLGKHMLPDFPSNDELSDFLGSLRGQTPPLRLLVPPKH